MFIGAVSLTVAQWLAPSVKESILPLLGGGNVYNKPNHIDKAYILADLLGSFEPDKTLPQVSSATVNVPTEELDYVAFCSTVNVGGTNPTYVNFPTKATDPYYSPQTREQQIYMLPFLMIAQLIKDNLLKIVESEFTKALESNQRKEVKENTANAIPVTAVLQESTVLQAQPVQVHAPVSLPAPTPLVQPAQVAPPVQVNTAPPIVTVAPPVSAPLDIPPVPVAPPAPPAIIQPVVQPTPPVPQAPPAPPAVMPPSPAPVAQAPPPPVPVAPPVVAPAPAQVAPPQMPAGLPTAPPNLDFINPLAIPDLGSF
jgi:hypothetical protein